MQANAHSIHTCRCCSSRRHRRRSTAASSWPTSQRPTPRADRLQDAISTILSMKIAKTSTKLTFDAREALELPVLLALHEVAVRRHFRLERRRAHVDEVERERKLDVLHDLGVDLQVRVD